MNFKELLQTRTPVRQPVDLPLLGTRVFVHEITADKAVDWVTAWQGKDENDRTARLITLTCHNEDGTPIFSSAEEAAELLSKMPVGVGNRLLAVAITINGMTKDELGSAEKKS